MRQLKYHVAGFIAREDGSYSDFPAEGDHIADFIEAIKGYDAVLMGHGTYEVGRKVGITSPYPWLRQYVFSRTMAASPDAEVELVREDAGAFVQQLKRAAGRDIYLCGGGKLAASLLTAGLIDAVIVKLNPVLFAGGSRLVNLRLTDRKTYASGVVLLTYRVERHAV